jgi:hypothetical protein
MFTTLDSSKYKTFEVVHGETITSSGVGNVDLLVATTQGEPRVLTLRNVHYIPQQGMSLISVDKAISDQGFGSPDLKKPRVEGRRHLHPQDHEDQQHLRARCIRQVLVMD